MILKQSLGERLVAEGLLTEEQFQSAVLESRKTGESLVRILLGKSLIKNDVLIKFVEEKMGIPHMDLASYIIDQKILQLIPHSMAKKYKAVPIFKVGNTVSVAMADPFDVLAIDEIRNQTGMDVDVVISAETDINQAISQSYGIAGTLEALIKSVTQKKSGQTSSDEPVIKFVSDLLEKAATERASDIHIEPGEKESRVRYRVDGVLHEISTIPLELHASIISRIKVMSKMDIAETRVPQDGRLDFQTEKRVVDVRVSSFPSVHGEKMVLRLLDKLSLILGLDQIGFSEDNLNRFKEVIKRPYGIILVTGPTGSGKTTTLYAALNTLNSTANNIVTIEDPVEYEIPGITQSQVNAKAGLTFANALRSILRQDPDIILVGEIRDAETAHIAVQAALTGHLVFSTLHTNDAAGALTRLEDMGIEPFLIASSVATIIAQRLVRLVCPKCKHAFKAKPEVAKLVGEVAALLGVNGDVELVKGQGCKARMNTGYKGRSAIFEMLVVTEEIRKLVIERAPADEIKKASIKAGMRSLRDDGLLKVLKGQTTLDEVLRVTQLD
ncbi:MAG: ATPase, T2SS/T4P/T4SS family [Candidatus Saganbacteria bacterium]|nr:ATPase, T2SS/T4P/T4SS family [Candidatus Saganbacteria bacterium]